MSSFFDEQGRTRVCAEAYITYAAGGNPRRTLLIGKRTISGWTLEAVSKPQIMPAPLNAPSHLAGVKRASPPEAGRLEPTRALSVLWRTQPSDIRGEFETASI
ncbi:hypothetical protein ACFL0O_06605 [Thermodesulfobacteriota bacterium]